MEKEEKERCGMSIEEYLKKRQAIRRKETAAGRKENFSADAAALELSGLLYV